MGDGGVVEAFDEEFCCACGDIVLISPPEYKRPICLCAEFAHICGIHFGVGGEVFGFVSVGY